MPLIIRNIETGAEYEVADREAFERVYGDNPTFVIASGLPVPVVLTDDSDDSEDESDEDGADDTGEDDSE